MGKIEDFYSDNLVEEIKNIFADKEARKYVLKRALAVGAAVTVLGGGIALLKHSKYYDSKGNIKRLVFTDLSGYDEPFDRSYEYVISDGQPVKMYKSKYINYLINNDTHEISTYVKLDGRDFNNFFIGMELFDYDTKELLAFEKLKPDLFEDDIEGRPYYEYLQNNFTWIPLTDSYKYVDFGMNVKDSYSEEEIETIKEKVLTGFELIEDSKKMVKKID